MQNELFAEPKEEFVLYHETQRRVILRQNMHQSDVDISNDWYESSLCEHLKWMKASELEAQK